MAGSRTRCRLRRCWTSRSPSVVMACTVQRSPFLTQSVEVRRSWRSLVRVMISSPTLARFPSARVTSASVAAGSPVQFGNEFPGGGEHDRIEALGAVVLPGGEHLFGDGGEVADMHSP